MISVIVVSLNTKEDFLKTIKSIISQTRKVELIIIDGNSNDGTKDEISNYTKFIDKTIIEKDDGIYFAMNKGIKICKKRWIYFLNSGDVFFEETTVEKILKILDKNENYDVVVGNSMVRKKNHISMSPRKIINKNTVNSCFSHQSTFTKAELLRKNPFNTNFKFASDFEFFLKLFKLKKKFLYVDNVISINKSGGISDKNRSEVFYEFKNIINNINNSFFNIIKINLLIFFNLIKKIIKLCLPNILIEKIIFYLDKLKKIN